MGRIIENYNFINTKIEEASKRSMHRQEARLVAVSKMQSIYDMKELAKCGVSLFGESKVQEALDKIEEMKDFKCSFHFIGRLQTNKVKYIVGRFSLIHSVDRIVLLEEINRIAQKQNILQEILIQVNLAGEEQKGGISLSELPNLLQIAHNMSFVKLRGLMLIPPFLENPEENRPLFKKMYTLFQNYASIYVNFDILSMGMSDDFEIAIEEGANLVRVGSALFGKRV